MKPKLCKRYILLSHFAHQIGGWNATKGVHPGRLQGESFFEDDEKLVRFLLGEFERDVTKNLKQENTELKAKLYDLTSGNPS